LIRATRGRIVEWAGQARRNPWNVVRVVVTVLAVALAVLIAVEVVEPAVAPAVGGLLLLAVLVNLVTPATLGRLVSDGGGFSLSVLGIAEISVDAAKAGTESGDSEEDLDADGSGTDLVALRRKLERRLEYTVNTLLPRNAGTVEGVYTSIGSLWRAGYLTVEEARTAERVLEWRKDDLRSLPPDARRAFLRDAKKLVTNFRASVLRCLIVKTLDENGWSVLEIPRDGKRPDLHVEKDGRRYRLASIVTLKAPSELAPRHVERLEQTKSSPLRVDRRIVVIPAESPLDATPTDDPALVKFDGLLHLLERS